ncbi:MAG: DUF418 domain-containing protein, partial [Spirochaetaceae bacterium]|nr:DUF418 domain-containing protein [Spirochaetaceae bacterium]
MNQRSAALGPVGEAERIEVVDVLRGFALCGILFVNIMWFKAPGSLGGFGYEGPPLDRLVAAGVFALAQAKFFTLFSFLFGWGFATQFLRAEERGVAAGFPRLYLRRSAILGLIGVAHIVLLSEGDILLLYAILGLALLALRRARPEILRRWVKWLLIVPAAAAVLMFGALALGRMAPEGAAEIAASDRETAEQFRTEARTTTAAYLEPAFARMAATRVENYSRNAWIQLFLAPTVLAMFVLGLAAGRRHLTLGTEDHRALLRRVLAWGLAIGLPVAALSATGAALLPTLSALMCVWVNGTVAGPLLAMAYGSGIGLLWQRPGWQRLLRPLAAMGRMALTNYLLQSVIATLLFYGYGL